MSDWYYVRDGEQAGPVSDMELKNLASMGVITPDTLVWREGLDEWTRYGDIGEGTPATDSFAPSPASGVPVVPILTDEESSPYGGDEPYGTEEDFGDEASLIGGGEPLCSECGRAFPQEELIAYSDYLVCPDCKPVFFQRLRESGALTSLQIAGFGQRLVAKILDGLILAVPMVIMVFVLGLEMTEDPDAFFFQLQLLFNVGYYFVWGAYSVFFHGRYGATPGKMILGIRVVRSDGSDITYLRAFGRFGGEVLSGFVCYIGYIIAAFDDQRRTLHDHLCDTRVVGRT